MQQAFAQRREVWLQAFKTCPSVRLKASGGAFYLFPGISFRGMSGAEICSYMLNEHDVAMVPDEIFGGGFKQFVRLSYGGDIDTQVEAAQKLRTIRDD